MPNIASLLKSEITRLARKEVRAEVQSLRDASASHRADIAALKRRIAALEKDLKRVAKASGNVKPAATSSAAVDDGETSKTRFSASGLKSHRQRLGLSAKDLGLLLNASALSVYKWESGAASPRAKFMPAIAEVRTLGKKEARARLEALSGQ